jgi:tRNA A-37 threonylcarbamoyl transferase component Bud32
MSMAQVRVGGLGTSSPRLIHGDLTTSNIVVRDADGRVVVIDFISPTSSS